jgi:hypothetical protein
MDLPIPPCFVACPRCDRLAPDIADGDLVVFGDPYIGPRDVTDVGRADGNVYAECLVRNQDRAVVGKAKIEIPLWYPPDDRKHRDFRRWLGIVVRAVAHDRAEWTLGGHSDDLSPEGKRLVEQTLEEIHSWIVVKEPEVHWKMAIYVRAGEIGRA